MTPSATTVNQDRLSELRDQGYDSDVLLARLALVENEGLRKDLAKMATSDRVYPEILPTQASLRWSTKNPNLPGFKREFWTKHAGIIQPDKGEWWLEWDWSGIEARMFTAYSGDEEDVELFKRGKNIHAFTCSKYLFEWAPDLQVDAPISAYNFPEDWKGANQDEERYVRAKNFRYGVLQYGGGPKAILGMPGIESLGLARDVLVRRAQRFLASRPKGVAWKEQVWRECIEQKSARTFMGHRRQLFGDEATRKKDGLNHKIQGSVSNLMAWSLIAILTKAFPAGSFIMNKHDGATLAFPDSLAQNMVIPKVKAIVEREWEVGQGVTMRFPADWKVRNE